MTASIEKIDKTEATEQGQGGPPVTRTADGLIDAASARRKANGYIGGYISDLMMGKDPVLIPGNVPIWRVTILLTYPHLGAVGEVGTIDVDALNAKIIITDTQVKAIKKEALALAKRTLHPAG